MKITFVFMAMITAFAAGQKCGRRSNLPQRSAFDQDYNYIVGGQEAIPHEFPWQVSFQVCTDQHLPQIWPLLRICQWNRASCVFYCFHYDLFMICTHRENQNAGTFEISLHLQYDPAILTYPWIDPEINFAIPPLLFPRQELYWGKNPLLNRRSSTIKAGGNLKNGRTIVVGLLLTTDGSWPQLIATPPMGFTAS